MVWSSVSSIASSPATSAFVIAVRNMRMVDVAISSRAFIAAVRSAWRRCLMVPELSDMTPMMPTRLKKRAPDTDVGAMSDSLADTPQLGLDAPAPRLDGPISPPQPLGAPVGPPASMPAPTGTAAPLVSPVLTDPAAPVTADLPTLSSSPTAVPTAVPVPSEPMFAPTVTPGDGVPSLPTLPSAGAAPTRTPAPTTSPTHEPIATPVTDSPDLPSLPTVAAAAPAPAAPVEDAAVSTAPASGAEPTEDAPAPNEHPMAHLMGNTKSASEASRKAAEIRAAKKAKAKKIKIGVAIGAIVFAAVVGPPLGKWFVNAINEAGDTSTEQGE